MAQNTKRCMVSSFITAMDIKQSYQTPREAALNNLRPPGRFTRDLFSRASAFRYANPLFFLHPHAAV